MFVSGGIGVSVSVGGGTGVFVSVGSGTGVSVRVGSGVGGTRVLVGGIGVFVRIGTRVEVRGGRTRLVPVGVTVTKRRGVDVSDGKGLGESVTVKMSVCVGTNAVTTCSVSAAAVSRLETAKSTIFNGSTVMGKCSRLVKSPIAIMETLHRRVKPIAPAARIPRGPAYSLAFTLVLLLRR